ncbi:hypothetical protein K502DRAFT_347850 [Neoconidiobolus thromboides FSU 785]|nr:hypothetical protein K502DRAFT_347850 [Neoconidiobolus thromboides FSU 785]
MRLRIHSDIFYETLTFLIVTMKLKLKSPKKRERERKEESHKKPKSNYYTDNYQFDEDYNRASLDQDLKEREWQDHLMDTLGEEEPDFWHHRFQQTYHDQKNKDQLMDMDEEEYRRYIIDGMRRKREKYTEGARSRSKVEDNRHKDKDKDKDRENKKKKKRNSAKKEESKANNTKERLYYFKEWTDIINNNSYLQNCDKKIEGFQIYNIPWPFRKEIITSTLTLDEDNPEFSKYINKSTITSYLNVDLKVDLDKSKIILKRELLKFHPDKFSNFAILPKLDCINTTDSAVTKKQIKIAHHLVNYLSMLFQELWRDL